MTDVEAAGKLTAIEEILSDRDTTPEEAQALGTERARILKMFPESESKSTARPTDPNLLKKRELDLRDAERRERKAVIEETLTFSAPAFDNASDADTSALMQLAGEKGKKPEDVLFSEDFNKKFGDQADAVRARIIAAQKSAQERELAAIASSTSEDNYVAKKPGISKALEQERRRLYRAVKGGESPESAPIAADPWNVVP
jgi:hypothetical protein